MKSNLKKILLISILSVSTHSFGQVIEPKSETPTTEPQQELIYDIVDEPADFRGGVGALRKYMVENLRYPQMAVEEEISGKCFLQFVVQKDGSISNIKVKKGVPDCPEWDAEAIRMVKSMPKWVPGKINEKAVNSTFSLPVTFKLN